MPCTPASVSILNRFQSQVGPRTIITLTSVILTFFFRYWALAWYGRAKQDVAPKLARSLRRSMISPCGARDDVIGYLINFPAAGPSGNSEPGLPSGAASSPDVC